MSIWITASPAFLRQSFAGSGTMAAMSSIRRLMVVGGGVFERRDGEYYVKSAIADYLSEMRRHFADVGMVTHVDPGSTSRYERSLSSLGVEAHPWGLNVLAMSRAMIRILRQVDKHTSVWVQLPQTPILPLMALLRARAGRFVAYVAGDWVELAKELGQRGKGWRVPLDNAAVEHPLMWADHVLVRGPKLLQQARRFNRNVEMSLPILSTSHSRTLREDSCQGASITILYVGKVLAAKGVDVLWKALEILNNEFRDRRRITLHIVGEGPDRARIEGLVDAANLSSQVRFAGYVDSSVHLSEAYREADILVIPSVASEGMPRVLDEGISHCLPIVASRVGGIPLAYTDREQVLMVDPGSVESLVSGLRQIIEDGVLRRALIAGARRTNATAELMQTAAHQHARILLGQRADPGE